MIVVHYVLKKLCHPGSSKASNNTKSTIFTEALKGEKRRHVVPACKQITRKGVKGEFYEIYIFINIAHAMQFFWGRREEGNIRMKICDKLTGLLF